MRVADEWLLMTEPGLSADSPPNYDVPPQPCGVQRVRAQLDAEHELGARMSANFHKKCMMT